MPIVQLESCRTEERPGHQAEDNLSKGHPVARSSRRFIPTVITALAGAVLALPSHAQFVFGVEDEVLVRVSDENASLLLQEGIAASSLDYGSFHMFQLSTADLFTLDVLGIEYIAKEDPYRVTLGELSFDPVRDPVALPARWRSVRQDVPELRMVQFVGPTQDEWLDRIEAAGLQIVQYIHPYTYVLWGTGEQRASALDIEGARWADDFEPAYRVLPKYRAMAEERVSASITLINFADAQAVAEQISALGGKVSEPVQVDSVFSVVDVTVDPSSFEQIARTPGVYSIQPNPTDGGLRGELSNQIVARNLVAGNAVAGYANWLTTIGLDGSGVIMANVDGGIFTGNADLTNRMLPCSGTTCNGNEVDPQHGSHTAAIMAGDGSSGIVDGNGFLRGLGVAPGAQLVEQHYSPFFTQAGGMLLLIQDSWSNNAVLSGNSWGPSGSPQGYDDDTRQVDVGVRDADPNTPGNQQFTFVLSFMNGFGGTQSQGSPDEAKNLFNIGSTNAQTGSLAQEANIFSLSANSAHGPALDGRTIPHMVAPGCDVDSVTGTSSYGPLCGTSMASPHVAGAAALFVQQYRNNNMGMTPSPALIKAAFLATAQSLEGNFDADGGVLGAPFDSKQGYGMMNMQALFEADTNGIRYEDAPTTFGSTGETWSMSVSPLDPAQPVRIMLVWTDAPGHGMGGSTPAWNNNLDLKVTSGGNTFYGNNIAPGGFSSPGGSPDAINNTEGVFLSPGAGAVTIEVLAADINSDGVPGNPDITDQDFSIACFNCAVEPGFAVVNTTAAQSLCAPSTTQFTFDVESILGYNTPVSLSTSALPSGVTVGFSSNPVVPGTTVDMTVNVTGTVASGSFDLTVTGSNADASRDAVASLTVANGIAPAPALGSPSASATGVSLTPTFTWSDVPAATEYFIQVAADASFNSIVASGTSTEGSFSLNAPLATNSGYFWRVRTSNACGTGDYSPARSFLTRDVPSILLVDDDDNGPDVRDAYTDALTAAGLDWDLWDTNDSSVEPGASDVAGYDMILWFSGDAFGSNTAGPNGASEGVLANYLDDGGCLILSAQDYLYDTLGFSGTTPNAFMEDYLGLTSPIDQDNGQTTASGQNAFAALGPYALSYGGITNYSDLIVANGTTASTAFQGNDGAIAVHNSTSEYETLFTAFPLAAIPSASDLANVISVIAVNCVSATDTCAADINGDSAVDISDLLILLSEFNTPGIQANIDGVGNVDITDLLLLLAVFDTSCD